LENPVRIAKIEIKQRTTQMDWTSGERGGKRLPFKVKNARPIREGGLDKKKRRRLMRKLKEGDAPHTREQILASRAGHNLGT